MNLEPNLSIYCENQNNFIARSEEAINEGLSLIVEARKSDLDLSQLFFSCIDTFARIRHEIAIEDKSEEASLFGRSRMDSIEILNYTPLWGNRGLKYQPKINKLFQEILRGKIPLNGEGLEKKFRRSETFFDRKCTFEVELFYPSDVAKANSKVKESAREFFREKGGYTYSEMHNMNIDERNFPPSKEEKERLKEFNIQVQRYKSLYPEAFALRRTMGMWNIIAKRFPVFTYTSDGRKEIDADNVKGIWICGKVSIEIDNKMYALSRYITWTSQDENLDKILDDSSFLSGISVVNPVDKIAFGKVCIHHQDRFLIEPTLQEISKIFKKAMEWNTTLPLQQLKENVGLIRYLFSHAMPFIRGSAAIGEWLEIMIYRSHGYSCKHNNEAKGDLEALVAPFLSTFLKQEYETTIELNEHVSC